MPLFALLFFCAFGILVGVLAHWIDHARVWPWLPVYALLCALGALLGCAVLPVLFGHASFLARWLFSLLFAMAAALLSRLLHRRGA